MLRLQDELGAEVGRLDNGRLVTSDHPMGIGETDGVVVGHTHPNRPIRMEDGTLHPGNHYVPSEGDLYRNHHANWSRGTNRAHYFHVRSPGGDPFTIAYRADGPHSGRLFMSIPGIGPVQYDVGSWNFEDVSRQIQGRLTEAGF